MKGFSQWMVLRVRSLSSPSLPLFQPRVLLKKPVTRVMPSTSGDPQLGHVSLIPRWVRLHDRQEVNSGENATWAF